jgi:hypothetical protein
MTELFRYDLMIEIISLKKDVDFVLKTAQDRIDELEIHRENARKQNMQGPEYKLSEYIEQLRDVKTDFDTGVALNLERLATEIEAEAMQVTEKTKSIGGSKRGLEELIKSNQRESALSAIKTAPDFIEIMNNSFEENLKRIKEMDERWQKRKL